MPIYDYCSRKSAREVMIYGQVQDITLVLGNLATQFPNRGSDLAVLRGSNSYQNFLHEILYLSIYKYFTSTDIPVIYLSQCL